MVRIFLLYVTGFCINSPDWNLSIVIFNLTIELVRVRSVNFSILYKQRWPWGETRRDEVSEHSHSPRATITSPRLMDYWSSLARLMAKRGTRYSSLVTISNVQIAYSVLRKYICTLRNVQIACLDHGKYICTLHNALSYLSIWKQLFCVLHWKLSICIANTSLADGGTHYVTYKHATRAVQYDVCTLRNVQTRHTCSTICCLYVT